MTVKALRLAVMLAASASLAACLSPRYPTSVGQQTSRGPQTPGRYKVGEPYQVAGIWYFPKEQPDYDEVGIASWYGDAFHLKATANGETFDMNAVSAAHTTLPLPSIVEVTNLENGRKIQVRVNDRGPFVGGRIIDLSHEAARELDYDQKGVTRVRVRYVGPAPLLGPGAGVQYARRDPAPGPVPPPPVVVESAPLVAKPAERIEVASLPPPAAAAEAAAPVAAPPALPLKGLRIQAGSFSSEANAQRAVNVLAPAGLAVIEQVERQGTTIYRVVLPAPQDEVEALRLRDRVAEIGFTDARVIGAL